jgi:hypothetical protein
MYHIKYSAVFWNVVCSMSKNMLHKIYFWKHGGTEIPLSLTNGAGIQYFHSKLKTNL